MAQELVEAGEIQIRQEQVQIVRAQLHWASRPTRFSGRSVIYPLSSAAEEALLLCLSLLRVSLWPLPPYSTGAYGLRAHLLELTCIDWPGSHMMPTTCGNIRQFDTPGWGRDIARLATLPAAAELLWDQRVHSVTMHSPHAHLMTAWKFPASVLGGCLFAKGGLYVAQAQLKP